MNIYLVTRPYTASYDTYDSCVVRAENQEEARKIHPSGDPWDAEVSYLTWVKTPEDVEVEWIGEDHSPNLKPGVVLASFNAG